MTSTKETMRFPLDTEGEIEVGNSLCIFPSDNKETKKIYLTKSGSAWITIDWLSEELIEYSQINYGKLFGLHPVERGKVIMYGKEMTSSRWHQSYLKTPQHDIKAKRSYMYAGIKPYEELPLPSEFQVYLDFVNEHEKENKYNQAIVNWYADGSDFIAEHSDCQIGMKANAGISIISLCEDVNSFRELRFTAKNLKHKENDNLYKHVKIAARNGSIITMHGDIQEKFRHKIPKSSGLNSSRISLTFRKF
ncbi:alpha-ketoglutarate-dependent dioxygenase AlkB [Flammeovirga aprica]|uniref:Alpha-ketoglutarate-dependent dioxygenase AlkB n=1 Tax=Flammeovirga aprica JL-4 TaxID=694437 RepID=A0A7X9RYU1_9BACT|nr:alpha-ketoglutarate-dependent dioxygenase AlkB [Flammeovirga aprica]NME71250.1 alpha-ketoglutarate-dependent dioxygenase AlkB [Flammeovirga aprica JL-4]